MDRKVKGITLIELLIAITIMAIILSLAVPSFIRWKQRYSIESDMRTLQSLLQEARIKAFSEKFSFDVIINGDTICYKCDTNDSECVSKYGTNCIKTSSLNYRYGTAVISISNRGIFTTQTTIYYPGSNTSAIDCIVISNLRVKVGKYNGSKCQ